MFFAKPGEYNPCGMYSLEHFVLLAITIFCIKFALKHTKVTNKEDVKEIIKEITICVWILEIIKIIFNFAIGNAKNPNNYIPLYFCSLLLYAGLFSSFGNKVFKKTGDVFLATGGLVAGICFIVCPTTSLTMYPIFHFISLQSFAFHGSMIYLGILINKTNYIEIKLKDIKYYFNLILVISIISYLFNLKLGTNLMFISYNFPNTPVEIIYNLSNELFTILMVIIQATLPFLVMYGIIKLVNKHIKTKEDIEQLELEENIFVNK